MSFASFPIETLDLPNNFREAALKANLTTSTILLSPIPKLTELLKCKIPFAQDLVKAVSQALAPQPVTVDVLFDDDYGQGACERGGGEEVAGRGKGKWISTGDEGLDECLGGGLRRGCLYEIAGESAAGKSHFALTLALCCQLSSLTSSPGGSLILTSERELSTDRLIQLGEPLLAVHEPPGAKGHVEGETDPRVKGLLDNILSNRVGDIDSLEHALSYVIPALLESRLKASSSSSSSLKPIRLIILDSLAALLRGGTTSSPSTRPAATSSSTLTERSKHLCIVADLLKALAARYDLAVVVINQVSDVFPRQQQQRSSLSYSSPLMVAGTPPSSAAWDQTEPFGPGMAQVQPQHHTSASGGDPPMLYASQARWFSGQSDVLNKEASLGIVWANAVNVRIMLSRTGRRRMLDQNDLRPVKRRRHEDEDEEGEQGGRGKGIEMDNVKPTLIRRMHVVFSPFCPSGTVDYAITPSGIHSLPGSYERINIVENMRKVWKSGRGGMQGEGEAVPGVMAGSGEEGGGGDYGELPAEYWDAVIAEETMAAEPSVMEETDVVGEADVVEECFSNEK
ncbi:RAD57 protein [Cryptococcus neoformans A2-102-5]|nr:RAD57 protein [Cryptococcus neoformans var. grubii D17-1]OXG91653.1 RAD57 protein [Cryptococcus neoformans var. grubii A2-102-5]